MVQVRSNLGSFRPAVLAALVKAFGIAGYVDTAFYDMVSEYVEQNIKSLGPHHLAEIAFGASKGGCVTERLQSSVEKVAPDFVKQADMRVSDSVRLSMAEVLKGLYMPKMHEPDLLVAFDIPFIMLLVLQHMQQQLSARAMIAWRVRKQTHPCSPYFMT